jgi:hypothetical protein
MPSSDLFGTWTVRSKTYSLKLNDEIRSTLNSAMISTNLATGSNVFSKPLMSCNRLTRRASFRRNEQSENSVRSVRRLFDLNESWRVGKHFGSRGVVSLEDLMAWQY